MQNTFKLQSGKEITKIAFCAVFHIQLAFALAFFGMKIRRQVNNDLEVCILHDPDQLLDAGEMGVPKQVDVIFDLIEGALESRVVTVHQVCTQLLRHWNVNVEVFLLVGFLVDDDNSSDESDHNRHHHRRMELLEHGVILKTKKKWSLTFCTTTPFQ